IDDLVGCELWDGEHAVGRVSSIEAVAGAAPLLHVALHGTAAAGGEVLVPFVTAFLEQVSLAERRITMRLPPGLVDINL
ncbi:MAG: 16S rRNA processing protein RimM, partial [Steroidobacterales bacterium]